MFQEQPRAVTEIERHVLDKALAMAGDVDGELVYLTHFGSRLYGTNVEGKSDTDIKGLFLPSKKSLLIGKTANHCNYSSNKSGDKNSTDDIDIELWSVQKWLLTQLPKGEVGAIDLLFSPSNQDCVLYYWDGLNEIFANPLKFLNLSDSSGVVQYGVKQARKYGIKGSRLGCLKKVMECLGKYSFVDGDQRLESLIPDIVYHCQDERYCCQIINNDAPAIRILGKIHAGSIKLKEFRERIVNLANSYGNRTEKASNNDGVDFKALSHAFRAIDEVESLLKTGKIEFPLRHKEFLMNVKLGEYTYADIEPLLERRLDEIMALCDNHENTFDLELVKNTIYKMYNEE